MIDEPFLPMNPHPHNVSSELSRNLGHHAHYVPSQAALPTGTYAGSSIPTSSHVQSDEPIAARFTGTFFLFYNKNEGKNLKIVRKPIHIIDIFYNYFSCLS